jgi:hypothetical protein
MRKRSQPQPRLAERGALGMLPHQQMLRTRAMHPFRTQVKAHAKLIYLLSTSAPRCRF